MIRYSVAVYKETIDMAKGKYSIDLRDLLEAGCHFGHQSRRWNPKMEEYIFTNRDGVHIFDLAITAKKLVAAMEFVRDWVASGKEIVFVGTKRQAAAIVREETAKVKAPFVDVRWLGGTLTNWEQMKKRIRKLRTMKDKREKGEYDTYTKKEQVMIDREIAKLERFFGGISEFRERPEALFVVDTHREITAVKEAHMIGAPVVGMVDSNADPDMITHLIPINDDAVRSIKLVVEHIARAYGDGVALRSKATSQKSKVKSQNDNAKVKSVVSKRVSGARAQKGGGGMDGKQGNAKAQNAIKTQKSGDIKVQKRELKDKKTEKTKKSVVRGGLDKKSSTEARKSSETQKTKVKKSVAKKAVAKKSVAKKSVAKKSGTPRLTSKKLKSSKQSNKK